MQTFQNTGPPKIKQLHTEFYSASTEGELCGLPAMACLLFADGECRATMEE